MPLYRKAFLWMWHRNISNHQYLFELLLNYCFNSCFCCVTYALLYLVFINNFVVNFLFHVQWVVTNLRPNGVPGSSSSSFSWVFDLDGIAEMYRSYEETNLWKFVENLPRGVHVNFLKAERSLHRWALEDLQRIHAAEELASDEGGGVEMHVLEDAGHWVHADNPDGLFRILSSSFQGLKT
ncbi:hypothetical protein SLEP1_g20777 [Rubroshorea leprosula]|uniref:Uncharacterized protein n=1 Tax=Rubroshorea leprosula TaxID=152421 RepID=A0AAV5JEC4_9ROSI|nr:hypothetical protein SLEP1_g20777 [Rubroshorea leprosula]